MMNKNYKYKIVLLLVLTLALMVGCGAEEDPKEEGLYTNLLDLESREKVWEAMAESGISLDSIDLFFQQVDMFNDTIENYGLVEEGFKDLVLVEPDYDPYEMQDIFFDNSPDFMGYNCRITSYELMRDLMSLGNPLIGDTNIIIFDENSIENGPNRIFDEKEYTEFRSLYSAVPTQASEDINVHLASVKKDWEEKQITFKSDINSNEATLISVFFHEEESEDYNYLFIGHVGVLVPAEDGGWYFIEKIAFQEPYQAILFYDKSKLNDYLLEKYDLSWGQNTAKPFVMENGELLVT